jgi:predicted kinase
MSRLVHINGLPGLGKSTLARLWADRHPLCLARDVDVLKGMLGAWLEQSTQAGLIARQMAIAAARVQLIAGRDVLVPQFVADLEFVRQLEQLSRETNAEFIEIVLTGDPDEAAARFARRTANPETAAHVDAARLLERLGPQWLSRAAAGLAQVVASRPGSVLIESVDGQVEQTYAALDAAISKCAVSDPPAAAT